MVTHLGRVLPVKIEEEMRNAYLDYAMSVIVARALPDVRDGLKPVQRRILYAMDQMGMGAGTAYRKSARLVGEVLGKFHPHGDAPVYEAMVRMAQDFSMRNPLVDGQGNFGSVDDDPPAAMRYTEARLTALAQELLANIEQDTVNFAPNFDASLDEPTVLPARFPNLLVNGASGIAVGVATNIPPHNLAEVCNALLLLIENPEVSLEELMRVIPGPDFPTAGLLVSGREGIRSAYATGHGRVVLQAKATVEELRGNRSAVIVTELPYQVNKAALVARIAELAKSRRIEGIGDIRDESDRDGMRMVVELRRDARPRKVLNELYKHTAMQSVFHINLLALVDGQPVVLSLKQALQEFLTFRQEVVRRRSRFELRRAEERVHLLQGILAALNNLDEVIALIRNAPDAEGARQSLMDRFTLSQVQAQAILEIQLRRLAAMERQRVIDEHAEIMQRIRELEELLADPRKVLAVVAQETQEVRDKYADARRTLIVEEGQGGGLGRSGASAGGGDHPEPPGLREAHPERHLSAPAPGGPGRAGDGHAGGRRGGAAPGRLLRGHPVLLHQPGASLRPSLRRAAYGRLQDQPGPAPGEQDQPGSPGAGPGPPGGGARGQGGGPPPGHLTGAGEANAPGGPPAHRRTRAHRHPPQAGRRGGGGGPGQRRTGGPDGHRAGHGCPIPR